MQCNYTNPLQGNPGYNTDPFNFGKTPPFPQIIGEGDVASVLFPDGSIQLYFVPANRRTNFWPPFTFPNLPQSNNLHCNTNADVWIVRSISHPFSTSCWNRTIPNVYGDQLPPLQYNSNFCVNPPYYYQKFHNDSCTSTTDIKYFYPKLRRDINLKYSVELQTEPFPVSNTNRVACHIHCCCKEAKDSEAKSLKIGEVSDSSTSYMSVDSACGSCKSKHKLRKRNKKKSKKSKAKVKSCECNKKIKSDKLVTTYTECACGSSVKDGTHTQTTDNKKKSQRSDIKTEIWLPKISSHRMHESESCSRKCCCKSTSEGDTY